MTSAYTRTIDEAAGFISSRIPGQKPYAGIILGSGLGTLADRIEDITVIPYSEVPGFPVSTAMGHKGNFIIGRLGGKCVIAMQGRIHFYEGYPMEKVTLGVRIMARLGIGFLFVSNAAGAINQSYSIGEPIILRDHINLLPNPLIGPNLDDSGARFPDMTCAYDLELQDLATSIGLTLGKSLARGVYLANSGPSYETPAEIRFYRTMGADLVGMSTVPEVIVARHSGIRVFGMSVVTNLANFANEAKVLNDGEDVLKQAGIATGLMAELFSRMIAEI